MSFTDNPFKPHGSFKWTVDKVERASLDTFIKKEFIEMTFNLEAKSVYIFKGIGYYRMNERTVAKYSKLCATFKLTLLDFPSLYIVESTFSHVHYLQTKLKN